MADPVLRPVDRGLPPQLQQLKSVQQVGDGQSDPGPGMAAARGMAGGEDASTAGGRVTSSRFAGMPEPLRGLLAAAARDGGRQVR